MIAKSWQEQERVGSLNETEGLFDQNYNLENSKKEKNTPNETFSWDPFIKQINDNFDNQQKQIEKLLTKNEFLEKEIETLKLSMILQNLILSQLKDTKTPLSKVYEEDFEMWFNTNCNGFSDAEKDVAAAAWKAAKSSLKNQK